MGGSLRRLGVGKRGAVVAALVVMSVLTSPVHADDGLDGVLGDPGRTYPDLVPDVTSVEIAHEWVWDEPTETFVEGPPMLYFDTYSQNLGSVPVELTADDPGDLMGSPVSQCVSWRADYVCREQERVGGFTWHDAHTHFHYEDFADYELRRLTRNGKVDMSKRGLVAISEKVSFCLMDSTSAREDASPLPFYNACNPGRQGISPGYADVYTSDLPGQSFTLPGISDGDYALLVTMDPSDRLYESNNANNRVIVRVRIADGATSVSIVGRSWPAREWRARS